MIKIPVINTPSSFFIEKLKLPKKHIILFHRAPYDPDNRNYLYILVPHLNRDRIRKNLNLEEWTAGQIRQR